MNEKRFVVETVEITDCCTDDSRIAKVITDTKETYSYEDLDEIVDKLNEQDKKIRELESKQHKKVGGWHNAKEYFETLEGDERQQD